MFYAQRMKAKTSKLRTTIAIEKTAHAIGVKLAKFENRDFSGMVSNAILERWEARKVKKVAQ